MLVIGCVAIVLVMIEGSNRNDKDDSEQEAVYFNQASSTTGMNRAI